MNLHRGGPDFSLTRELFPLRYRFLSPSPLPTFVTRVDGHGGAPRARRGARRDHLQRGQNRGEREESDGQRRLSWPAWPARCFLPFVPIFYEARMRLPTQLKYSRVSFP